jgi:RNA polymerase sigma factor (sigma-70 family)
MDWQIFFFTPENDWPARLLKLARRRFPQDEVLAEEACTHVLSHLSADGWKRLGMFGGRSAPGTFLTACMRNALEDFSHARFGKPRPPAWLVRLGGLWLQVFKWLCLERTPEPAISDRLAASQESTPEQVRSMVRTIRARHPNCGQSLHISSLDEINDSEGRAPIDPVALDAEPEARESRSRVEQALLALAQMLGETPTQLPILARADLSVSDEETILLRLIYVDGMKLAEAARAVQAPEHTVRRQLQRCLTRLRGCLSGHVDTDDGL